MESVRREPVPVLRGLVYGYTGFPLPDVAERARLELPSGAATMLIAFAEPIRIGLVSEGESEVFQRTSFVAAGRAIAAIGRHRGRVHGMAHLGHDVKAITGLTPGRLAELRCGAPPGSALDRLPGRVTSVLLG